MMIRFILVFFFAIQIFANVTTITYNTGLLRQFNLDLVPCVISRIPEQVNKVFEETDNRRTKYFFIFLQEIWTNEAFEAYTNEAKNRGFDYYPKKFNSVKNTGMLNITNGKIIYSRMLEFTKDIKSRGILENIVIMDKKQIKFANVHTEFSLQKKINSHHLMQLRQINEYILRYSKYMPLILGGDFNTGPSIIHDKTSLWFDVLLKDLEEYEWGNPSLDDYTWNPDLNSLVSSPSKIIEFIYGNDNWQGQKVIYDHILLFGAEKIDASLVFDKPTNLTCNRRANIYLSDHFGVKTVSEIY